MKAQLKLLEGHTFIAKSDSNHWVALDTGKVSGGSEAANDPFQLLVIAATGCCAIDVVDILRKGHKQIDSMEIETEVTRAESAPKVIRTLHFHVKVRGAAITSDQVIRAIDLSLTKYCSVALSLDRSILFLAQFTLNGVQSEIWEIQRDITPTA